MYSIVRNAGTLCLAAGLAACSSMTTINSVSPQTTLVVKDQTPNVPSTVRMKDTSFGNYEFKAQNPGADPFYGVLPLKFHGGRLAADILLFAPGAFFNLRSVFPYYEIDVEQAVVRYKNKASDAWHVYHPTAEERERARQFFGAAN